MRLEGGWRQLSFGPAFTRPRQSSKCTESPCECDSRIPQPTGKQKPHLSPLVCQYAPSPLQIEALRIAIRPGVIVQPTLTRAAAPVFTILKNDKSPKPPKCIQHHPSPPLGTPRHTLLPASEMGKAWCGLTSKCPTSSLWLPQDPMGCLPS